MRTAQLLTSLSFAAVLAAQVTKNENIPLQSWRAPLYWQPSVAENDAIRFRLDPTIRPPTPDAATPAGSLVFVAMTPCRVVDTRTGQPVSFTGAFGPPSLGAGTQNIRAFPMQSSTTCSIPSIAQAYSLNVTVVPQGPLGFLTLYPATAGSPQPPPPTVSTLNSIQGYVVANAAIVPAGADGHGGIDAYASNSTDLIVDINGYYAPYTGIALAQGTVAAPSLSFAGDAGTGIYSSGMGVLNFTSAGTTTLTVGSQNTGLGYGILGANTGNWNTAIGAQALMNNTAGGNNTASGFEALLSNTIGSFNTGNGESALQNNVTGNYNTATGSGALFSNTTGSDNSVCGADALDSNTNGSQNTALGEFALGFNATGNNNTAVGFFSGDTITGSNNIDIGNYGTANDGIAPNSGVIRIGAAGTQTSFFAAGIASVTVGNSAPVLINASTGQLGTIASSRRYKQDIQDMGDASDGLLRLRPVTFRYRQPYEDGTQPIDYGLIAEEVAEVYPDLAVKDKNGQVETVQYHKLIPMLLNELQRLQARVAALEKVP